MPRAAYLRLRGQEDRILEQAELFEALTRQSADNPDQLSFDAAIGAMASAGEIKLPPAD